MGKSTISMVIFQFAMLVITRGYKVISASKCWFVGLYQSTNNWVHLISLDLQHYSSSGLSFYLYRAHQWLKPFGTGWHCQCQKTTGNALGVFFNTFIKGQRETPNLVISASYISIYIYIAGLLLYPHCIPFLRSKITIILSHPACYKRIRVAAYVCPSPPSGPCFTPRKR